jgi:hypothetical protein
VACKDRRPRATPKLRGTQNLGILGPFRTELDANSVPCVWEQTSSTPRCKRTWLSRPMINGQSMNLSGRLSPDRPFSDMLCARLACAGCVQRNRKAGDIPVGFHTINATAAAESNPKTRADRTFWGGKASKFVNFMLGSAANGLRRAPQSHKLQFWVRLMSHAQPAPKSIKGPLH